MTDTPNPDSTGPIEDAEPELTPAEIVATATGRQVRSEPDELTAGEIVVRARGRY